MSSVAAFCCLCGDSFTARKDFHAELTNVWKEKCVVSICRIMRIASSDVSPKVLRATDNYCDSCWQLMRDVEFSVGAMDKLQQQILSFRQILLKKLESHKEALQRRDSPEHNILRGRTNHQFAALYEKVKEACTLWTDTDYLIPGRSSEKFLSPKSEKNVTDELLEDVLNVQIKSEPYVDGEDSLFELLESSDNHVWETQADSNNPRNRDDKDVVGISEESSSGENGNIPSGQVDSDPEWSPSSDDGPDDFEEEELQDSSMPAFTVAADTSTQAKRSKKPRQRIRIANVLARRERTETGNKKKRVRIRNKDFPCNKCTMTFTKFADYKSHKQVHRQAESKEGQKTCAFCGIWLKVEDLEEHENQHRGREFPFSCMICEDAKFHGTFLLSKHMREVHPSDDLQICQHCGSTFGTKTRLKYHIRIVHQEVTGRFECKHCGKVFLRNYMLVTHTRMFHTESGDSKPFVCEVCGRKYTSASSFYYHRRTHRTDLPYKCEVCGKGFQLDKTLRKHEQIHSGLQFQCPDCPKIFSTQRYLKQHSRCHLAKGDPFQCKICGKGFQTAVKMNKHKEVHEERPFECPEPDCEKSFSNARNLRQHSRCHLPRDLRKYYNKKYKKKHAEETPSSDSELDPEIQSPEVMLNAVETKPTT